MNDCHSWWKLFLFSETLFHKSSDGGIGVNGDGGIGGSSDGGIGSSGDGARGGSSDGIEMVVIIEWRWFCKQFWLIFSVYSLLILFNIISLEMN